MAGTLQIPPPPFEVSSIGKKEVPLLRLDPHTPSGQSIPAELPASDAGLLLPISPASDEAPASFFLSSSPFQTLPNLEPQEDPM